MDSIFSTLKRLKDAFISDDEEEEKNEPKKEETPTQQRRPQRRPKHTEKEAEAGTVKDVHITPKQTYTKTNGKENTLLAISQCSDAEATGPNSEVGRRVRSMKIAHSMNSVYRKIHKDKNVHTDRHYLVAVAEQIKEENHK